MVFVLLGREKGKEKKNPVRWEGKREKNHFSHRLGSEKTEKLNNFFPFFGELKEKIKIISHCLKSENFFPFIIK